MKETTEKLKNYMCLMESYFVGAKEEEILLKQSKNKWSKKEVLGHLIDSGIHNLIRFTEIQFASRPYEIRKYDQEELVLANDYQNAYLLEMLGFWLSINKRILRLMENQTEESLRFEIIVDDEYNNLEFLMKDYVLHMKHHINQITQ